MYHTPNLESKPAHNAIVTDWTNKTLGEKFHFEILPQENPNNIPSVKRAQTHEQYMKSIETSGCQVLMYVQLPFPS